MDEKPPLSSFVKSPIQKEDLQPVDKPEGEIEVRYLRGKKGDTGTPGKNAVAPSKEELERIIKPLIPLVEDGKTPTEEELVSLIKPLIPIVKNGADGKTPSKGDLLELISPLIPIIKTPKDGIDGKDGSPDTPKQVIEKINKSKGDKIKRSRVEGLDEVESIARTAQHQVQNFTSLGGSRQTAIKVSGTLLGTGINTINFVGATGTKIGDGSEVNVTTSGSGTGQVNSVVAGTGISVDSTDPANPIVSATGSGSGITRTISTVSTTTAAASAASTDYVYLCSGTFTITLPTTVANKNLYTIKNIGAGIITVATTGGETIDGGATASIPVQYTSLDLIPSGGNWNVV